LRRNRLGGHVRLDFFHPRLVRPGRVELELEAVHHIWRHLGGVDVELLIPAAQLVNSCVTILPLHQPVVLAKALATADWMSGGRMMVTFGVGWLAREFELLGVPFRERGRIADEYLAAIVELWTSDAPRFDGRYLSFDGIAFEPKPVQKPHLPIWIGGDADAALRRAAKYASGWWPFLTPPEQIAQKIDYIESQPTYDGRPFEVMHGLRTNWVGEGHVARDDPHGRTA